MLVTTELTKCHKAAAKLLDASIRSTSLMMLCLDRKYSSSAPKGKYSITKDILFVNAIPYSLTIALHDKNAHCPTTSVKSYKKKKTLTTPS